MTRELRKTCMDQGCVGGRCRKVEVARCYYCSQPGDTLKSIAAQYHSSWLQASLSYRPPSVLLAPTLASAWPHAPYPSPLSKPPILAPYPSSPIQAFYFSYSVAPAIPLPALSKSIANGVCSLSMLSPCRVRASSPAGGARGLGGHRTRGG